MNSRSLNSAGSSSSSVPHVAAQTSSQNPARQRPGRKARSLVVPADTLLNFSSYQAPRRTHSDSPSSLPLRRSAAVPPRPREQFVQANHRFAVDPTYADGYAASCALHDAAVPWDAVDVVFVERPTACPICLEGVRCPRVTPCGHVFDYVCILQHLAHSANSGGAKCPLCSSRVVEADLKACTFRDAEVLQVGLPCAMQLVSREKGSMIARLHLEAEKRGVPSGITTTSPFFSRFGFADETYLLQLLANDADDLREMVREDASLTPFVNKAMSHVKAEKTEVRARRKVARQAVIRRATTEAEEIKVQMERDKMATGRDFWFFYQARDTRNLFLHPVNHRCLATEYSGNFNEAAMDISGTVLQLESHTMDEQLRKKYKFLEHLPDGCEFAFVELDLAGLLSAHTKAVHAAELQERKAARRRKEARVKKEDRRLEKKKTASLQEYFSSQAGVASSQVQPLSVDSQDASSFPALKTDESQTANLSPRASETPDATVADFSPPGVAWGGADISSYSSVTSNMGLFPALGQASAGLVQAPAQGPPLSSSPQSPGSIHGAWAVSSSTTSQPDGGISPPEEMKRGKKSHGRATILLSNAGTTYRL